MENRIKKAQRITIIGFVCNLILTVAKLAAGFLGNSAAMIADAVHSLSDFATDIIVIFFIGVSGKESDEDHHYGHGKFETFATLLISVFLFAVALGMMWKGIQQVKLAFQGIPLSEPTWIALIAAVASILIKEALYIYTIRVGNEINSNAIIANAWHHRSDAFSSIGAFLGIGGAILLGGKWAVLDPIAAVLVSFFILKVAFQLGLPSVNELLEKALPKKIEEEIMGLIYASPEVKGSDHLRTRKIGSIYAIDIHIKLDPDISFVQSHDVATAIEQRLRSKYGKATLTSIHTEPYFSSPVTKDTQ